MLTLQYQNKSKQMCPHLGACTNPPAPHTNLFIYVGPYSVHLYFMMMMMKRFIKLKLPNIQIGYPHHRMVFAWALIKGLP